jgi:hypothetical protein
MNTKKNMFFSSLKRNSLYVILLLISAFSVAQLTKGFRYSNYRWIYHIGWVSCYVLHLCSLILSFVNSINIIRTNKMNIIEKSIWLIVSLTTIFFWVYASV